MGQEKVVVVDSLVTGHRAAVHQMPSFTKETWRTKDFYAHFVFKEHADIVGSPLCGLFAQSLSPWQIH